MTIYQRRCFVLMPFSVEFRYFYLFLKNHLEHKHTFQCYRADSNPSPAKPIIDQINDYIANADLVIADISHDNPNVFYELGIAHSLRKNVILIRNSANIIQQPLPFDIRHRPVIFYEDENAFLRQLDSALNTLFYERYKRLYEIAQGAMWEFQEYLIKNVPTASEITPVTLEVFSSKIQTIERSLDIPDPDIDNNTQIIRFTLPYLIQQFLEGKLQLQQALNQWLSDI